MNTETATCIVGIEGPCTFRGDPPYPLSELQPLQSIMPRVEVAMGHNMLNSASKACQQHTLAHS